MKKAKLKLIKDILKFLKTTTKENKDLSCFKIKKSEIEKKEDKKRGKYLLIGTHKDKYFSEEDPRSSISKLRELEIPCLVDTKYFVEFSKTGGIYLRKNK